MRNIFPLLSGNEKLKALLGVHIAEGKLSHAYIFEGDDGSGKMTCALSAAASLACEKRNDALSPLPCGKCTSCRKIFGLFSPDVHIVSPKEKKSIGVDAIRDITSSLYISPNENDYCVYIIDDAHLMTAQAQNALLKSLEEPPPFAIFFLLCIDSKALLDTIRSRSPVIRMDRFSKERIAKFLLERSEGRALFEKDRASFDEAVMLAGTSPGRALELISEGKDTAKKSENRKCADLLVRALVSQKSAGILDAAAEFPKGRENALEVLRLCEFALRDILVKKCTSDAQMMFLASAARLKEIFSAVEKAVYDLSANANEALVLSLLSLI